MKTLTLGMAVAAMLACAVPTAGFAQTAPAAAASTSAFYEAHSTELVSKPRESKGPSLVFLYGNDCASCAATEAALSAAKSKFPQFTFLKANGQQELGMRPQDLVVVHLIVGEDIITSFDHFAISADHAEAFLAGCVKLIDGLQKERDAVLIARADLHRFRDEFLDRDRALKIDGARSLKEIEGKLAAAHARNASADEIHELEAQKSASVLATGAVLKALAEGTENAFKPMADALHANEALLYARGKQMRAPIEALLTK